MWNYHLHRGGWNVATQSFNEDLILRTLEAVRNLERAIELADKRGPLVLEGTRGISDDPECARRAIERARWMKGSVDE